MKVIFMGTPDFAVPCLQKLIDNEYNVAAVFTQPDKKVGRKQIVTPPPVKVLAEDNDITVYQPNTMKSEETINLIKNIDPDLIIVVAYGKILPKEILEIPKYGCINVHASLLPKYRGAAPIQWAILNGDTETGVAVQQMNEGIDTGDLLLVKKTEIGIHETSAELFDRLSVLGADALIQTVENIKNGTIEATPQTDGDFGYASMISREMSAIDWNKSAFEIHNQVRGLQTWPCADTVINGKKVKIHKTLLSELKGSESGRIMNNKGVLTICCGDGNCLDIIELQPEGKKRMDIKSFLAGNAMEIGAIIGK